MVRSGSSSHFIETFEKGWIGIDFGVEVSLDRFNTAADFRSYLDQSEADILEGAKPNIVAMLLKIKEGIKEGDDVITYDSNRRLYLIGTVSGKYEYHEAESGTPALRHRRAVKWISKCVSRDNLEASTRNSLGSVLSIFSLTNEVWTDIQAALTDQKVEKEEKKIERAAEEIELKRSQKEAAHEALKDKIVLLDPDEMEQLIAALLNSMGFRATVSPKGPDRGVDVTASPDGLGLQEPRIKAEVKHRKTSSMGAPEIRSFIGGLRPGDRGIYFSSGGFTKEAKYEADRANIPTTLIDLDRLATLIEANYDTFDNEGRALLPLTRIYWPAD